MSTIPAGTLVQLEASGYAGGWTAAFQTDTVQRLQAALTLKLAQAGLSVLRARVTDPDPVGFIDRVAYNRFRYFAEIVVRTTVGHAALRDVQAIVSGVLWDLTGEVPVIANLTAGDAPQPRESWLPSAPEVSSSLRSLSVIVVAIAAIGIVIAVKS